MAHVNKVVVINDLDNPTAAQDKIAKGANFLADAVKQTLGPYGRNVLLEKGLKITNDGIGIAREIQLKDEIEDLGLRIAREALIKTNDLVGDGTTTAATLFQAIFKESLRLLPGKNLKGKKSIAQIRKQIADECAFAVGKLKEMAVPIKTKEELIEVTRVSVEDKDLAELIGTTQWELGQDGVLLVEESNDIKDSVEKISGIRFDNGFGTSLVVNNQEKQRLEVENVPVIMTNYTFSTIGTIKRVLDELVRSGKQDIVIIARAFTQEAIKECMENHRSGIRLYPVNAPYVNQGGIMRDLRAVLGGKYYDQEESSLEDMTLKDVGFARRVICERFSAVYTGVKNEQTETHIVHRIEELKKEQAGSESPFEKRVLQTRISQLTNGFAIIKVGALSDADRKYKYDKVEDAVHAVKAALQEGTVKGAGLALKEISEQMSEDSILKRPLLAPYEQIMVNAGENFVIEDWVRNPVKVERVALENACQIAVALATAGGAIANERIKPKYVEINDNE